jgi:hypothetical protein
MSLPVEPAGRRRMFDVRVTASENFNNYTAYTLKVSSGGSTWQISKRYSDFEAFNSKLRDRFPMLALPKLPGKVWFGSMSQGVVEHRKQVTLLPPPRRCLSRSPTLWRRRCRTICWSSRIAATCARAATRSGS